jgi:N-acyl-phosphatidylethanolamine-hydrolysing phospholipase D
MPYISITITTSVLVSSYITIRPLTKLHDSMDNRTLKLLHHHQRKPHFFVPLGNTAHLESLQIPSAQIHSLDWWESRKVSVTLPSAVHNAEPVTTSFTMTCTPSQHTSARAVLDRAHTLWSSWAIDGEGIGGARSKVWFAGDTGYRRVKDGDDEDKVPVCPAFKEIGEKFGGFDLALIPIG